METVLIVVTLASLTAAIAALAVTRRVVCRERGRSAARVAALVQAAGRPEDVAGFALTTDLQPDVQSPQAEPEIRVRPAPADAPAERALPASGLLFETVRRPGSDSRRLGLALGAGALIVGVAAGSIIVAASRAGDSRPAAVEAGAQAPEAAAGQLELLALGHERGAAALTISGTVRNPSAGRQILGARAAVSLLDRDGALLSRRDVPLDVLTLEPGRQSTFSLTLPDAGNVMRYRVSFRTEDGAAVPHVDRRAPMAIVARAS